MIGIDKARDAEAPALDPGQPAAEPLGGWERGTAVAVGVAAGGGGGYAVFVSSNQAGTAILLILSAIFLLIGIQGTSLIRFSTGNNTVELERRRRADQALKQAAEDPDLKRAEGIVEGIAIAEPSLPSLPEAEWRLYLRRLQQVIRGMGYQVTDVYRVHPGVDLFVKDSKGLTVRVETQYIAPEFGRLGTEAAMRGIYSIFGSPDPVLIVSNRRATRETLNFINEQKTRMAISLVTWQSEDDNGRLREALSELFDAVGRPGESPGG